jgi:hypothetical protein
MNNQSVILLVISLVVLAIASAGWILQRLKRRRALGWPAAEGQVDSTDVRLEQRGNNQSAYVAEVNYAYTGEGERYSGRLRRTFLLHGKAHKWAGNYAKGRALSIRYNPTNVKDSVLLEREQAAQARNEAT